MFDYVLLGTIQGVAEWLPVSSEGVIVLMSSWLGIFGAGEVTEAIQLALFLHLGTFLAALVYFWRDVWQLLGALFSPRAAEANTRKTLWFLAVATLTSSLIGGGLLVLVDSSEALALSGSVIMAVVGGLLLVTGILELVSDRFGEAAEKRDERDLGVLDGVLLGVVQGLAALPGLSRSGTTVAALLLRRYEKTLTLRLSFLLSLPIVLGGNIVLNFSDLASISSEKLLALGASFVFGILTIHLLLGLARRISFGPLVILFGLLTLLAAFFF